jgi:hypothetical protein
MGGSVLHWLFVALSLLLAVATGQKPPGCLNHKGEVVDWFVLYYTPQTVHTHAPLYGYLYMDSNANKDEFEIHKGWGDEGEAPLGRTIAQVGQHRLESVAWNDQLEPHQGLGNSNKAHSKFFMALQGKKQGFAVVHSTPKFPTITDAGLYSEPRIADSQKQKAQHFLCLTLRSAVEVDKLLKPACYINPNIYHNSLGMDCAHFNYDGTLSLS